MIAHQIAEKLASEYSRKSLNEADTRHKIIDVILHDVLGWPRNRVSCEEYINPGFADYVLRRTDGEPILFIEAKKEGAYFELPESITRKSSGSYISVKTLLTNGSVKAAIEQVRTYCLDMGCDVGAVTNGHTWIIFKTFQKEHDWRTLKAFVIPNIKYFSDDFIAAFNIFEYAAITDRGSLRRLLLDSGVFNRDLYYPKEKVIGYNAPVDSNPHAANLRVIADRYFGVINAGDADFMEQCYVSDRDYQTSFKNARKRIEDAVTPYLEQYNVQDFVDTDSGGAFGGRIFNRGTAAHASDVVVLFGGKGVGKSTFLKKLLFHKPPPILRKNAVVAMVDLLATPPDQTLIRTAIWTKICSDLDTEKLLQGSRDGLCLLFKDRFNEAVNQDLFGLVPSTTEYNVALNHLIRSWKNDLVYVAERLTLHLGEKHKAPIVVIDNTDQFNETLQESCFSIAQEISKKIACLVVISMREERFYASSIHGLLDAYQNSGFHISGPSPKDVFLKRVVYVLRLLSSKEEKVLAALPPRINRDVARKLFEIFRNEFQSNSSHLASFLSACSHGNIRLALELFRGFLVSGYTNVNEMAAASGTWWIQTHQVLKPFMIPNRFFYDEKLSRISNIFQVRSKTHGSHFTALRILSDLNIGREKKTAPFIPVAQIKRDYAEVFSMTEDFDLNMDMLLKFGLIEANNRLDEFDSRIDNVKITAYGEFMLTELSLAFTYIELVSLDCAISDSGTSSEIAIFSNDEYKLHGERRRDDRIKNRIAKTGLFISYLEKEEDREITLFKIHDRPRITDGIRAKYISEEKRILRSSKRNSNQKPAGTSDISA